MGDSFSTNSEMHLLPPFDMHEYPLLPDHAPFSKNSTPMSSTACSLQGGAYESSPANGENLIRYGWMSAPFMGLDDNSYNYCVPSTYGFDNQIALPSATLFNDPDLFVFNEAAALLLQPQVPDISQSEPPNMRVDLTPPLPSPLGYNLNRADPGPSNLQMAPTMHNGIVPPLGHPSPEGYFGFSPGHNHAQCVLPTGAAAGGGVGHPADSGRKRRLLDMPAGDDHEGDFDLIPGRSVPVARRTRAGRAQLNGRPYHNPLMTPSRQGQQHFAIGGNGSQRQHQSSRSRNSASRSPTGNEGRTLVSDSESSPSYHHAEPANPEETGLDSKGSCQKCRQTFSRFADLERHLETVHKTRGEIKCDSCNGTFSRQDAKARHLRSGCRGRPRKRRRRKFDDELSEESIDLATTHSRGLESFHV